MSAKGLIYLGESNEHNREVRRQTENLKEKNLRGRLEKGSVFGGGGKSPKRLERGKGLRGARGGTEDPDLGSLDKKRQIDIVVSRWDICKTDSRNCYKERVQKIEQQGEVKGHHGKPRGKLRGGKEREREKGQTEEVGGHVRVRKDSPAKKRGEERARGQAFARERGDMWCKETKGETRDLWYFQSFAHLKKKKEREWQKGKKRSTRFKRKIEGKNAPNGHAASQKRGEEREK